MNKETSNWEEFDELWITNIKSNISDEEERNNIKEYITKNFISKKQLIEKYETMLDDGRALGDLIKEDLDNLIQSIK